MMPRRQSRKPPSTIFSFVPCSAAIVDFQRPAFVGLAILRDAYVVLFRIFSRPRDGPLGKLADPFIRDSSPFGGRCLVAIFARQSAAQINPATSAAIVEGEYPVSSSHRSWGVAGPCATTKSAAGLICL